MNDPSRHDAILGCLLGGAVGDALGLPTEGMSRARIAALRGDLRHRLIFGHGMFSDDTEHTLMVAAALLHHSNDATAFQRALARSLRWWLLALPAGAGLGTARAIVKLWLGFQPSRSGVRSAGNGPAMRSAILGVMFRDDTVKRREFALASCRITHTDPRAEESAIIVAEAAAMAACKMPTPAVLDALQLLIRSNEMASRFARLRASLDGHESVTDFAVTIGCEKGVSGFAPNSVAVALYAWLRHRHCFATMLENVILCGGDTDTVAAIAGGICGAEISVDSIPQTWISGICDWPRSVGFVRRVATALTDLNNGKSVTPPMIFWPVIPFRNLFFLSVVLCHGFRRLLPPYGFALKKLPHDSSVGNP